MTGWMIPIRTTQLAWENTRNAFQEGKAAIEMDEAIGQLLAPSASDPAVVVIDRARSAPDAGCEMMMAR
ncbi:MAG: hypothetical protein WBA25_04815 [Jannaschia sp.]